MFENLCTLPLSSDLFAQAVHPSEPIVAVGLSSGHVECFRLPSDGSGGDDDDEDGDGSSSVVSSGTGTIDTVWRTRRHKGSCRTLAWGVESDVLYSAGTDGLLKAASSTTGQVVSKIFVPASGGARDAVDPPTLLHALSPQTLLLATDSAALHILDLRTAQTLNAKPVQTHFPHDDYISSLTPLPPTDASTSGYSKQWITTGGTTLAVTDLRRGVLVKSEDQEEELLSSVYVTGLRAKPGGSRGEKAIIGSGNGVLTLWEKGVWDDQDERIIVDVGKRGGESLDSMVVVPENVGDGGKNIVVGLGDGSMRVVKLGVNKIVADLRHDEVEAVLGLGFDVEGRLISGGGSIVKVWQEGDAAAEDEEEEEEEEEDSDDEEEAAPVAKKRNLEEDDSDDSNADSSDEDDGKKRRRKRKKSKAGKKKQVNGILKFKGL